MDLVNLTLSLVDFSVTKRAGFYYSYHLSTEWQLSFQLRQMREMFISFKHPSHMVSGVKSDESMQVFHEVNVPNIKATLFNTDLWSYDNEYCIQGNFRPSFIFAHFALWNQGEIKIGLIELYINDRVRKKESEPIQDWVNQSRNSQGRK